VIFKDIQGHLEMMPFDYTAYNIMISCIPVSLWLYLYLVQFCRQVSIFSARGI